MTLLRPQQCRESGFCSTIFYSTNFRKFFMLKIGPFCRGRCSFSGNLASASLYINYIKFLPIEHIDILVVDQTQIRNTQFKRSYPEKNSIHSTACKKSFFCTFWKFVPIRTRRFFIIFRFWYFSLHYCVDVKIFFLRRGALLIYWPQVYRCSRFF